jgi:hypothetical protein
MPAEKLPQACGIAVCALVVLGLDASPAASTFLGVVMGAMAHYGMALAMKGKR